MDAAISIRGLKKTLRTGFLGRRVDLLHGFDLDVPSGHIFGFVGPNGAGKSTTIKQLIGAARPTSGSVAIFGRSPEDPEVRRRIGYLPELPNLPGTVTPRELLRLHAGLSRVPRGQRDDRIDALLTRVELAAKADTRIGGFSKGMQQRVGLALALVGEPDLLILDEPMSGLDPIGRRLVRDVIRDQKQAGRTVFFSSHVLPDVEALCDEIALLAKGRVVVRGALEDVLKESGRGWELRFRADGEPPAFARGLGELERHGPSWALRLDDDNDPIDTANRLREAGCSIEHIDPQRASLEDHIVALLEAQGIQEAA